MGQLAATCTAPPGLGGELVVAALQVVRVALGNIHQRVAQLRHVGARVRAVLQQPAVRVTGTAGAQRTVHAGATPRVGLATLFALFTLFCSQNTN
jgi:hypothetical protein